MLFKKWAVEWAEALFRNISEVDNYKIDLVRYVLEALLSMLLSVVVLCVFAAIFGILKTALLIALVGAVVKNFTGGLHLSTPLRCAVAGGVFILIISYLSICFPLSTIPVPLRLIFLLVINIIVWFKAPRETFEKPLNEKEKSFLTVLSRLIMAVISLICLFVPVKWGVNELFYGVLFQVFNLLEASAKGIEKMDKFLGYIEKKPIF
jgi:accessory gene regulator B